METLPEFVVRVEKEIEEATAQLEETEDAHDRTYLEGGIAALRSVVKAGKHIIAKEQA